MDSEIQPEAFFPNHAFQMSTDPDGGVQVIHFMAMPL